MKSKTSMPMDNDDYKAKDDARVLMDAKEIEQDPARLKAAMAIISKKKAVINSIGDLKKKAKEVLEKPEKEE